LLTLRLSRLWVRGQIKDYINDPALGVKEQEQRLVGSESG